MEFKVQDSSKEKSLRETAESAPIQIKNKRYETDLLAAGIDRERIFKPGFAFCGKEVMVVEAHV